MHFEIHPATPKDAAALTEVFFSAFSSDFDRQLFPVTPASREWWINKFINTSSDPSNDVLLKAVDSSKKTESEDDVIAGFAIWCVPEDAEASSSSRRDNPPLPEDSDKELCEMFFGWMHKQRDAGMGQRRHYFLDMLATHPAYHGQGVGTQLLKWGLSRADQEGIETFLCASPQGRRLYEKYGFSLVTLEELRPGYLQASMVRPKKESGVDSIV